MTIAERDLSQYAGGQADILSPGGHYRGEINTVTFDGTTVCVTLKWAAVQRGRRWIAVCPASYRFEIGRTFWGKYGDGLELEDVHAKTVIRLYSAEVLPIQARDVEGLARQCEHSPFKGEVSEHLRIPLVLEKVPAAAFTED